MGGGAGVDPRRQQIDTRSHIRVLDELGATALLGPLLGQDSGATMQAHAAESGSGTHYEFGRDRGGP
jgi:hypothetical protein